MKELIFSLFRVSMIFGVNLHKKIRLLKFQYKITISISIYACFFVHLYAI